MSRILSLAVALLFAPAADALNLNNYHQNNFQQAKTFAAAINADAPGSFYCGCKIQWQGKRGFPISTAVAIRCAKTPIAPHALSGTCDARLEFGHQRQCWQDGGRKNCSKDPDYRRIETDLHNLQPAVGEVNGDRGNFAYSQWNGSEQQYGQCEMKIDFKLNRRSHLRGRAVPLPAPISICATSIICVFRASRRSCLTPGTSSIP